VLTKQLLRVRVVKDRLVPQLVDPDSERVQQAAAAVFEEVTEAVAHHRTRGHIDEALADLCSERPDHKLVQGLAKICLDRTTFDTEAPVDPVELRAEVFRAARAKGPLALTPGLMGRPVADDVLAEVGARHGLSAEATRRALYADRKDNERALALDLPDPAALVHRYNLGLAQAVLLHAAEVRITLPSPTLPRIRQLLRWARFHQLIVTAERTSDALTLVLDGPTSLFRQSTAYGRNLSRFLPAVALQERWSLSATILWTKRKHRKTLQLDHGSGLVSHLADTGAYLTREQEHFQQRFVAYDTDWELHDGDELLPLGAKRFVFPDYTLRRGDQRVHLQMVGFWRKETLQAHLDAVARHAPRNLLVAVSKRLAGDKAAELPDVVIPFTQILSPRVVVAAADALVQDTASS
jgi:predicted nuclease of restriction endonuclease-like RecB superfamily